MEDFVYYGELFNIYGSLLNESNRKFYKLYYEENFTLQEIADLEKVSKSYVGNIINKTSKKLKEYESRQKIALNRKIQIMKLRYEKCLNSKVFKEPLQKINERYMMLDIKVRQMESYINQKYINEKAKAIKLIAKLDALSPLKTLSRGYSIITLNGKTIKEAKYLKKDDEINIKLFDGQVNAKILKKECEEE